MTDITPSRLTSSQFERPTAISFLGYALGLVVILWCLARVGFSVESGQRSTPLCRFRRAGIPTKP